MSPVWKRIALTEGAVVLAVAAIACVTVGPLAAYSWRALSGQPYAWAGAMSLRSVSMVSADEGWAVGNISGSPNSLLIRYQHGRWTILPKPAGLDKTSEFGAVSMVSATDGWALASIPYHFHDARNSMRTGSAFVHFQNGVWAMAGDPLPYIAGPWNPSALVMTSATDGWATVEDHTLHYDGAAWREVMELTARDLGGGAAISATGLNDAWIGGRLCMGCNMWPPSKGILHYDGHTWTDTLPQAVLAPSFPIGASLDITGLAMLPPSEGWAAANCDSGALFLHYVAGRWTVQGSPVKDLLRSIAMRSPTEGWAAGESGAIYRYDGDKRQWALSARPEGHPLYGVATAPSGEAWAVGLGGRIYHYRKGAWETETNVVWSQQAQAEWT